MTASIPPTNPDPDRADLPTEATTQNGVWAKPREHLEVDLSQPDAREVHGRRVSGPVQGFGKMWQKTFRVRLDGVTVEPEEVVTRWRERYGEFWPEGNEFRSPLAGVTPGEIPLISGKAGGLRLSTGVLVLYADATSFSFITPEGHPFAGLITFSAAPDDGTTVAQVELLIRAHDVMVEFAMALGGHKKEERMWQETCANLARSFGVDDPQVDTTVVCVDRRRQWRRFGNLRHDAVLRALGRPFRRR